MPICGKEYNKSVSWKVGKGRNRMSSLQSKLQHKYALSEKGAKDMIKAFVSVTCSNLVLMFPVWMLYFLVRDYLQGTMAGRGVFYIVGCVLCLLLIALTTLVQYRATFLATYVGAAGYGELLWQSSNCKLPVILFSEKGSVRSDQYHYGGLCHHGDCILPFHSGTGWFLYLHHLIAVGTFFLNWRMAIAALWVLPVSFLIVGCLAGYRRA